MNYQIMLIQSITINLNPKKNRSEQNSYYILKSELLNQNLENDKSKINELDRKIFITNRIHYLYKNVMIMHSKIIENSAFKLLEFKESIEQLSQDNTSIEETKKRIIKYLSDFAPIIPFKLTPELLEDDLVYKLLPGFSKKIFQIIRTRFDNDEKSFIFGFIKEVENESNSYFVIEPSNDPNESDKYYSVIADCIDKENNDDTIYMEPCNPKTTTERISFWIKLDCEYKNIKNKITVFKNKCKSDLLKIIRKVTKISQIRNEDIDIPEVKEGSVIIEVVLIGWKLTDDIKSSLLHAIKETKPKISGYNLLDISEAGITEDEIPMLSEEEQKAAIIKIMREPWEQKVDGSKNSSENTTTPKKTVIDVPLYRKKDGKFEKEESYQYNVDNEAFSSEKVIPCKKDSSGSEECPEPEPQPQPQEEDQRFTDGWNSIGYFKIDGNTYEFKMKDNKEGVLLQD